MTQDTIEPVLAKPRAAILIDVHNLYLAGKAGGEGKLNYKRFLEVYSERFQIVRALAYVIRREDLDQGSFMASLTNAGFDLRIRDQKLMPGGKPALVNSKIAMTLDAFAFARRGKVDTLIFGFGDSDYVDLISAVKAAGCVTEVTCFQRGTSNDVVAAANRFTPIGSDLSIKDTKQRQPNRTSGHVIDYDGLPQDD
jgi:uncharacterized LabA/DUF88 family protein